MTKMSPFQIKNFRKQTGLSQKAFAQAVDLPIRTYRSYESGERAVSYTHLVESVPDPLKKTSYSFAFGKLGASSISPF